MASFVSENKSSETFFKPSSIISKNSGPEITLFLKSYNSFINWEYCFSVRLNLIAVKSINSFLFYWETLSIPSILSSMRICYGTTGLT